MNDRQQNRDPTPEEIRLACLEIQATWSDAEEKRRRGIRTSYSVNDQGNYEIPQGVQSPDL